MEKNAHIDKILFKKNTISDCCYCPKLGNLITFSTNCLLLPCDNIRVLMVKLLFERPSSCSSVELLVRSKLLKLRISAGTT